MKKFFKRLILFVLVFVVTMYFIGSCTSNNKVVVKKSKEVHEVTPEEYEKEMQELIGGQASFFENFGLNAYADDIVDDFGQLYKDFFEKTPVYKVYKYLSDKSDLEKSSFSNVEKGGGGHYRYPVEDDKSTVVVNYEYDFYGKNRVVYNNGTYEIIECRVLTSAPVSSKERTGVIKFTRTNQNYSTMSFSFDISLYSLSQSFSSSSAFTLSFYGLNSYVVGCNTDFISNYLGSGHFVQFAGNSVNSIKQFDINDSKAVAQYKICYNSWSSTYPNVFSVCSTSSNDYEFSQSVDNYYSKFGYWRMPNLYYNNNAGDTITENNINNYIKYGYTYNNVTNSVEFDPDVYLNYFDTNIKPLFESEFNSIFSKFPDIDSKFGDLDIKYNNVVDIINNIPTTTTTTTTVSGTYPIVTGDINVSVDVTFPEEFYKTYPALTTEPALVADSPDIDYALDEPLPVRALEVSGVIFTLASDFISDLGLMPIALMCVSLCFISMFFL